MSPILSDFASYYRPHRRLFLLDFGSAVVSGLLELAFPVAVTLFIDRLLPTGQFGLILLSIAGLLAVYALSAGLQLIVTYWGHMLGIHIETEMRQRAFTHLQKLSFAFFDSQKTGHLVGRLTKDLEEIGEVAHHGPEDLFIAVMTLLGAAALMLWVHVPLALLTMLVVPITAVVTLRYGAQLTSTWRQLFLRVGEFNARIEENVGGIRVVQAFANELHERQLFAESNRQYFKTKLQAYKAMALSQSLSYFSTRFVQLVVMLAGAWFVVTEQLTAGGFVGFLLLLGVFFRPLEKISAVIETYPKGIAGFQRYRDFLATEPDIADRPSARDAGRLSGEIQYRSVDFTYAEGGQIIRQLDLTIQAGETVALVGASGAGKSTVCALLPRFYEVDAGSICIDGTDIRDMTLNSLRSNIGIVQQDVFLFAGTIRENVAYGRLDASDTEICKAIDNARLGAFVASLAAGLDTVIGERGVRLSGGQKQRLSIARVFLKNPPILLLDEATSALDTETEQAIRQSLDMLAEGRTTLIIAHRLATIVNADRIVVVDGGRVVEEGTHAELIAISNGHYRRLHESQSL